MGLNISKGNMYKFITHTWNTVKGQCYHNCSYCYMKKWGNLKPVRFDEKEIKTNLGSGNFIFVGSSCDMFAEDIPDEWIERTLNHCMVFDNKYLFQTKNPERFMDFIYVPVISDKSVLCATIESNRCYFDVMGNSPRPENRAKRMSEINCVDKYVSIEPIIDFDLFNLINIVKICNPVQVNIGADSGGHNLPEPSEEKILQLIKELNKFTIVEQKKNLERLLK